MTCHFNSAFHIPHSALVKDPQQPRPRAPLDVALGVGWRDRDAHLQDDLFPRAGVGDAVRQRDPMLLALAGPGLHPLELGEQGAEQLELPGVADLAVGAHRFDLRQEASPSQWSWGWVRSRWNSAASYSPRS